MKGYFIILILLVFLVACEKESYIIKAPETVSFANEVQPIFTNSCVSCHGTTNPSGGLTLTAGVAYTSLLDNACIVPGDTVNYADSKLYKKMNVDHGGFTDDVKKLVIQTWVKFGAPLDNE